MTRGGPTRAAAGALAAALSVGCAAGGYEGKPRVAVVDGDPVVQMTPQDQAPGLEAPLLVPLKQHTDPPFRNEKVLGLALGEPERMYPVGLLDDVEVVDDEAGGVPFVVVRSPLAGLSTVLDRRVGGRTLTIENSGAVWRDVLVLRDRETGTYWAAATGRALSGPLASESLTVLPAAVTTAEAWRELYPSTLCLETGKLSAVALSLRAYAASSREGVSGKKTSDRRYPPKETVYFAAGGSETLAFTAEYVRAKKSLEAELDGRPLTVEWDGAVRAPRAFRPAAGARQEVPLVPIYWFALVEQFPEVRAIP